MIHQVIQAGFNLTLYSAVVRTFTTNLFFSDLMLGVEGRKFVLQKKKKNQKFLLQTIGQNTSHSH